MQADQAHVCAALPWDSPAPPLRHSHGSTPSTATSPCSASKSLDPERKALFDQLWAEARIGHEQRLCEQAPTLRKA